MPLSIFVRRCLETGKYRIARGLYRAGKPVH